MIAAVEKTEINNKIMNRSFAYFRWKTKYFLGSYESVHSPYDGIVLIRMRNITEDEYLESISKHPTLYIDNDVSIGLDGGNGGAARLVKLNGNKIVRLNASETEFFMSATQKDASVWSDIKTFIVIS